MADPIAKALADKANKQEEKKDKTAHELALEQGIPVAKQGVVKRLVLSNGTIVHPTEEGYFIALNAEIATQLEHFDKQGRVEIILPAKK